MATTIDTFVVELLLNGTKFSEQAKGVTKDLNSIKNALLWAGKIFDAVQVRISQFANQAQELGNLSSAVSENAEDLQAWGEAVKREGGTAAGFNATVKKLSDDLMSLPFNGGNSPLLGGLSRLGVQFRNLDGSMRKPLAVLQDLSAKFQGMSTAQSLALGQKMGLDDATIRLLQKGRQGLDELLVKYKALGVMSNEDIKTGERLKKMFLDYQQVITALGLRFTRFFLPAAEKVSQGLTKVAQWMQQQGRIIEAVILGISLAISGYLAPALLKVAFNPVVLGLMAIAAAVALVVEDFLAWKEGADSALGPVYDWLSSLFDESSDLMIALRAISDWFSNSEAIQIFAQAVSRAFKDVGTVIKWVWDFITGFGEIIYEIARIIGKCFAWVKQDDYEGKGAYEKSLQGEAVATLTPEQIARGRAMIASLNGQAQGVQAVKSGSQNINNSRTVNQTSHIDKIIVNNPGDTFTETMNDAVAHSSVNIGLQGDGFVG